MPFRQLPFEAMQAFARDDNDTAWAQAAHLIALGLQLEGKTELIDELDDDEKRYFGAGFPPLKLSEPERLRPLPDSLVHQVDPRSKAMRDRRISLLRKTFKGDVKSAAELLCISILHGAPPTAVAAAASFARLVPGEWVSTERLRLGLEDTESSTVRQMAADALARMDPNHPLLQDHKENEIQPPDDEPAGTSITVHGTWARLVRPDKRQWWRPGDEFFEYLKKNVSTDLYDKEHPFRWTGGYHTDSRKRGADDLTEWLRKKAPKGLQDVYAHSHGGNVVLEAGSRRNISRIARLLVLISVPARRRSNEDWAEIGESFQRIVSIRSRLDLVILLDRARLRFPRSRVTELLPKGLWFSHGAILKGDTWRENRLDEQISYERSLPS